MNMHRWWVKKVVGVIALVVIGSAALGWLVTSLWNWLLPPLLGLSVITFWQGLGLFLLGRLLFGGFRILGGHHHGHHHHHMHERWKHMTPEERESFSRGLHRCGWGHGRGHGASSHDEASATSRAES